MNTPKAENRISLSRDAKDPFGSAALEIKVSHDPHDARRVLDAGAGRIMELLDEAGLGPTILEDVRDTTPGIAVHWAGTARMHASTRFGVCDSQSRVYGSPNIALGDASVFPTPVEKNPTLTLMALSARAALRLARDLSGGVSYED
jgi:choline dehydrogenase-like flavoprotein